MKERQKIQTGRSKTEEDEDVPVEQEREDV